MANGDTIVEHRLDADGADPLMLTGVTDRNLQEVKRLYGIRLVMRGDHLILSGGLDSVERAAPVVQHMIELSRLRAPFDVADIGRVAAEEALDDIQQYIEDNNMVFIAAGMGGGTGTGAAPIIARAAREQGILTAHDPNIRLRIDKSTFTRLGTCEGDGGCAHSIYTGEIGETAVTRSRFEAGTGGHYVKSRAARTIVEDSSFDDANGRGTNYMIDLPNGGNGRIVRNWFVQGRDKENWSAFIAVGAEQANYSSDGLVIADNDARLAPGLSRSPAFVADWTGDRLDIGNNELGAGLKPFERR